MLTQVEFLVDGQLLGSDSTDPYSFNWDARSVGNGIHTLTAIATDNLGNQSSTSIDVTVNNCSYSLSSTSQSFLSFGGNESVTVSAPAGCNWNAASSAYWITITQCLFSISFTFAQCFRVVPYPLSWMLRLRLTIRLHVKLDLEN